MRGLLLFAWLISLPFPWLSGQGDLLLEPTSGYYPAAVEVRISGGVAGAIFFTTDGSQPSPRSRRYTGDGIRVSRSAVVRVAVFKEGEAVSETGSTYLIDEPDTELMTLSVGIDPWRLFDSTAGWFMPGPDPERPNWSTHREYPAHFDLLEGGGTPVHSGTMGFRLFGGTSRAHPQKSFSLSGRKQYGNKRIEHAIFGPDGLKEFQFLVARNGGSDWGRSHIRDALMTGLLSDASWDLDVQDARPARVYLNGKYWGLYHLREKINPRFLADHHEDVQKDSLSLLEHEGGLKHGSRTAYDSLKQFMRSADLSRYADYAQLQTIMDVDNFQRLQIAQTYFDNRDAGGNIRYWRPQGIEGRFRWILYDVDQGFGLHRDTGWMINTLEFFTEPDGPAWPNPPWSTLFQRKLLANPEYRRSFVNRSLDYLHTDFCSEVVGERIDAAVSEIEAEMPLHLARWSQSRSLWSYHVDQLRRFGERRPEYLREFLREYFRGGEDRSVTIQAGMGGYVVMNDNLYIGADGLTGNYFSAFPLALEAIAEPGFRFSGWRGMDDAGPRFDLDLRTGSNHSLYATFEPANHPLANVIVVNEVCPRSTLSGDWLELYNRGETQVDLTGWFLVDAGHQRFVLPRCTIKGGGYLVICEKGQKFRETYPTVTNLLPGLTFGLDKRQDRIGLYAPDGSYVNAISYELASRPDSCFTYGLALPGLDNGKARNWVVESGPGTPATANAPHLQSAIVTPASFWLRIGVGISVLLLVGVVRYLAA